MHVPGHNPYLTQGGETYDALVQYLTGFNTGYEGEEIEALTDSISIPISLGGYQYQGMSPEIMQALGNVFMPSGTENFNVEEFAQGNISEQIQNYLSSQGLLYSGEAPSLDSDQYWAMGDEGWANQLFATPSSIEMNPIDSVLGFTNVFDPESLANTLSQLAGIDPNTGDPIRPGEVKALTPEMIEKTTSEYYTPYEEAQRAELVEDLASARTGVSTGGFAGSAARQAGLSGAERLYRGGYEDILASILKARCSASTDVLDTIYGWQELMDTP